MPISQTALLPKQPFPLPLHQQAFNHALQPNIIFNVTSGNIVSVNQAACKLLGYTKKELLTKNRKDLFNTRNKLYRQWYRQRIEEGHATADLQVIRKSGRLVPCAITSVEFKDESDVTHSIMSLVDLRIGLKKQQQIDLENDALVASNIVIAQALSDLQQSDNKDWMQSITRTSYDVIWDWDLESNLIQFGKGYEQVFGYKLPKNKLLFTEWMAFFLPAERAIVRRKIKKIFASGQTSGKDTYTFTSADGSTRQVIGRANIVRDSDGKAIRMIGVIHDQSKMHQLEDDLQQAVSARENAVVDAIVEAKELERSDLGKELHDNVNQLLGASMLYLDMARSDVVNADIYLTHSAEYTKNAIAEIRQLSRGLTADTLRDFGLCEAIEQTAHDLMATQPATIHCQLDIPLETQMTEPFRRNIFRIIQEQLNNIIKHAQASRIQVVLCATDTGIQLSVEDDGKGFDTTKKSSGIGLANIVSRANLYKGNARFRSEPGKGCTLTVSFPPQNCPATTVLPLGTLDVLHPG